MMVPTRSRRLRTPEMQPRQKHKRSTVRISSQMTRFVTPDKRTLMFERVSPRHQGQPNPDSHLQIPQSSTGRPRARPFRYSLLDTKKSFPSLDLLDK